MAGGFRKRLRQIAFWIYSFGLKLDYLKLWKLPRILRAVRAARLNRDRKPAEQEIVFICDHPTPRDAKLSNALRTKGWRTVLLMRKVPSYEVRNFFDVVERFHDAWDALEKSARFSPTAYHVVSTWSFRTAAILIRYRPGKIVFDNTDQLAGMVWDGYLWKYFPCQLGWERYCMENAQGLRCRDLAVQVASRSLGYRIRAKKIFFPDYGWGVSSGAGSRAATEREMSVVFCGSLAVEKLQPENRYLHYLELAKAVAVGGVPFHLYPTVALTAGGFEDTFSEYLDAGKTCSNLQVHRPVPPETLAEEMRRYSFALYVWGNPLHLGTDDGQSQQRRKDVTLGSRYYDYVEAGLIILTHDGRLATWLTRRYGLGVVATKDLFSRPRAWLEEQSKLLRRRAGIETEWTMGRQIHRLEHFYRGL